MGEDVTMPDNETIRSPEPESEEYRKFKAAMLKIVSVRRDTGLERVKKLKSWKINNN